ncbi:MAG: hypothetical protein J6T60_13120 [Bacteroidales bacterium]|nr:hypothetical protein [Bacteroidales bacterium]
MDQTNLPIKDDNRFIDWEEEINNLNFNKTPDGHTLPPEQRLSPAHNSKLREAMLSMLDITTQVGGILVQAGQIALKLVFEAIKRFPNTACGLLIVGTLHAIANCIPFFGFFLNGLLLPFDVVILGAAVIKDLSETEMFKKFISACSTYVNGRILA